MESDWSTPVLVDALETTGTTLSEGSYGDATLYTAAEGQAALAVFRDGRFAVGSGSGPGPSAHPGFPSGSTTTATPAP